MEVYILRHGIAEEAGAGMKDSERALTPEGKKKLRSVLRAARAAGAVPGVILTSPYRRAVETAKLAAEEFGGECEVIATKALVPGGLPEGVWQEIRAQRSVEEVLLAGHEPLLSQTIAYLLNAPPLAVDLKKGALACISVEGNSPQPRGILKWLITAKLVS